MRKLIIAVLVLISLESFAQPTNYTWYKQRIRQHSLMLDSMLYIPRYNGTPSGVRANENSAIDGAIAVDTANHRVYIYSGNAWRRLANYSELGVDSIWRVAGKDSIFWSKAGNTYKIKDSIGSGGGGSGGGIGAFQDSVANVRDFGAVGDGSTEDSTAFKNALATGRDVYVPKGLYKITAINLSPVAGQTIFGDGENTRIITAQTGGAIFKVVNPNVKFMNLTFEGSGKTSSLPGQTVSTYQTGIWVVINSTTITGCTFRKFNGRGLYIFHPSATYIMNNTVINNRFFQNTVGIESDYGADYLLIANNSLDSNYACMVEGGNANVYYLGNQATQSTYGYYSYGGALHGSIVGGSFNHCTTGLRIPSGQQGLTITDTKFWYSDIVLGSSDTVARVSFYNCVVEGSNVTLTKAKNNKWVGGYIYGSSGNVIIGTGLYFENVITAPAGLNNFWTKTAVLDSSANTLEGISIGRGIYAPNLPTGKKLKQLYWDGGTVYVADSTGTGGGGGGLTIGTTSITSGTDTYVPFQDGSVLGQDAGFTYTKGSNRLNVDAIGTTGGLGYLTFDANGGGGSPDFMIDAGSSSVNVYNTWQLGFGVPLSSAISVGIKREADAVLKITNGSSGYGSAIMRQLIVGSGNTFAASSDAAIHLYNGTVPTGSITNGVLLYSEDVSASAELKVRDEAGNITTLSPHNFGKIPGGRSEKLAWSFYSQRNGEYITADMTKALRTIENQSSEIEELKRQVAELKGLIYEMKTPVKLIHTGKVK